MDTERDAMPLLLMYHSISPYDEDPFGVTMTSQRFEQQMRWLSWRGLRGTSVRELLDARTEGNSRELVGLTIDDGYEDFLTCALPILDRCGFTATVFAVAGQLGGTNVWDADGPSKPLLTTDQLRQVAAAGMEIGSHGYTHVRLSAASEKQLDDRDHWLDVIWVVRARYHGTLVYAANFNEYVDVSFWDSLDLIGIDAYWSLSQRPTSDAAVLERAWQPIRADLAAFAAKNHRRILFTEAGYTSERGTTTLPYSWTISQTPDQSEQAAAYQALLASFDKQSWWAGVFWWVWDVLPDEGGDHTLDFSPRGKLAENVVRRWWAY
jgi:peptidoglycan/xylan/chitin deacetylase (PgdA/CDA1 family)